MRELLAKIDRSKISPALLEAAIASSSVGIVIADINLPDKPLIYVNPAFEVITGYSRDEVIGRNCRFLQGPDTDPAPLAEIRRAIANHTSCRVTLKNYRKDGTYFWNELLVSPVFDGTGNLTHFIGVQSDVTGEIEALASLRQSEARYRKIAEQLELTLEELTRTQAKLVQQEKMSSLGQLVAGIAHEINNPVGFIHGNLDFVCQYIEDLLEVVDMQQQVMIMNDLTLPDKITPKDLDFIRKDLPNTIRSMKIGTDRIKKIVLSLRNFARLDEAEMKRVDIHEGIDSSLLILQHRLRHNEKYPEIFVNKRYSKLPEVECYPAKLNEVFFNILNNAIDALEMHVSDQRQLPEISITTSQTESGWVQIEITDNGCGMSEDIQKNIFDPFFTTKPVGQGTGLGLSVSYQIIEEHGGILWCNSKLEQGTTFTIQIPTRQQQVMVKKSPLTQLQASKTHFS